MARQIGGVSVGTTTSVEFLLNTDDISVIPACIAGNQALTLNPGTVLQDGAAGTNQKVGYTNADVSPTGLCILVDKVVLAVGDPPVTVNGLIRGTVRKSMILDDAGAAADAAAFTGMPGVLAL